MSRRLRFSLVPYAIAVAFGLLAVVDVLLGEWLAAFTLAIFSFATVASERRALSLFRWGYAYGVNDAATALAFQDAELLSMDPHPADFRPVPHEPGRDEL